VIDFSSAALDDYHQLDKFDCGVPSLNEWLVAQAYRAKESGTAKTYVWTHMGGDQVIAYYPIAPHLVSRNEVSGGLAGGVSAIPGYLLARLALDGSMQGHGLGGQLLRDALERIIQAAAIGSGRLIVVDAIDDQASGFYRKFGFRPVKDNPRRLVHKIATVRKSLQG
jgi:GNAT superfamily N-acetyltransferase